MNWITLVTFTGILFGLLLSLHFLIIRRPGIAIRCLGAYTLTLTIGLSEFIFQSNSITLKLSGAVSFLYGPFLYLYIKSGLLQYNRFTIGIIKHFVFFILYLAILIVSVASSASENDTAKDGIVGIALYEMLFIQIFSYCIYAMILIRKNRHRKAVEDLDIGKMKITFMRVLVIISILLFFGSFATTHIFLLKGIRPSFEFQYTIQISLCVIIFIIALLNTETMHAKKLVKAY